ncbi:protein O-mannosyl-transferase family [Bdellovibrio sp. HCB337]|uniref:protein O-mannosyl-transferase family n=1 Tax=Bdellovibrio sp. HCB337 TaxID=3394358 RepID=UPI0039A4A015
MFISRKSIKDFILPFLLFGFIAFIYISRLSTTVQIGDTGELATAAFKLFVPHPPGYPLWVWLNAAFVRIIEYSSIFWRVSFFNVCTSLGALYFVWRFLKPAKALACGVVLTLAFSRIFWRYSELPDVFILNAFFASCLLYLYFSEDLRINKKFWIPLVFSLGLTNHHTLIFLSPIVIDVLLENKKYRDGVLGTVLGILIFLSLYASLMLLDTRSLHSWGNISSIENLFAHVLRQDYGTFQLVGSKESGSALTNWLYLGTQTLIVFYSFITVAILATVRLGFKKVKSKKLVLVLISLTLYGLVFFALSNTPLIGFRYEIMDRFIILFHIMLCFALGYILKEFYGSKPKNLLKRFIEIALVVSALLSLNFYSQLNNFKQNTIVEDYATNLLREAPVNPTVIFTSSDTRFFALRYVQQVIGLRPDVLVVGRNSLFFPWFVSKVQEYTSLKIDAEKAAISKALDFQEDILLPNLDKFSFITTLRLPIAESYHQVILPVGRLLMKGKGLSFYDGSTEFMSLRSDPSIIVSAQDHYDVYREIWTEYSFHQFGQAQKAFSSGNVQLAKNKLESLLQNTPWSFPAALDICKIRNFNQTQPVENCDDVVNEIKKTYFEYY